MTNTTLLQGEDSVTASAESTAAFYCFYSAGGFANGTASKADHPGKLYMGITPTVSDIAGADTLDIENGDATNEDAVTFVKTAKPPNLNLPTLYTSESNVNALMNVLATAGVKRSEYYLFQADWNDKDSIPAGVDIAQYENTVPYDKDVAYAYVFKAYNTPVKPTVPAKQTGTVHSDTTGGNAKVYSVDGGQTWLFHKPAGFLCLPLAKQLSINCMAYHLGVHLRGR
jgi:hypothetical protein